MQQAEWTDQQIKAALRDGKHRERTVEYIFKVWYRYLASAAARTGITSEDIEEVVNEAVWQLVKRVLNTEAAEIEHLKTYAYRIALNEATARQSAKRAITGLEPALFSQSNAGESHKTRLGLAVRETENELEKMGEPCRTILLMRGWGYGTEEIAAKLSLANRTVKNKVGPCREELIQRLGGKPF